MYYIHDFRAKNTVPCKGRVMLPLKAFNVSKTCYYCLEEGYFFTEVVPGQLDEFSCVVAELLNRGNYVELMVQEIARFFLEEF